MNGPLTPMERDAIVRYLEHAEAGAPKDDVSIHQFILDLHLRLRQVEQRLGLTPPAPTCRCGKPGTPRVDNGLAAGIHCDDCWAALLSDCRSRSY